MLYQVEFMIRMPAYPKEFQWQDLYIRCKNNKIALKKSFLLLRSFRKKIFAEVKKGKRRPDYMLSLAISRIVPTFKSGRTRRAIYKRKRKFGNHKP